jgi:hypothetical protein
LYIDEEEGAVGGKRGKEVAGEEQGETEGAGLGMAEGMPSAPMEKVSRRKRVTVEVWDEAVVQQRIEDITAMVARMFPATTLPKDAVRQVVREAFETVDGLFAEKDAVEWGQDFEWPLEIGTRDAEQAEAAGYDLRRMAEVQHLVMSRERLNVERVKEWVPETDPDHGRMLDLAKGMQLIRAAEFVPNVVPPPMRALYKKVHRAVNKVQAELWKDGLVPEHLMHSKWLLE